MQFLFQQDTTCLHECKQLLLAAVFGCSTMHLVLLPNAPIIGGWAVLFTPWKYIFSFIFCWGPEDHQTCNIFIFAYLNTILDLCNIFLDVFVFPPSWICVIYSWKARSWQGSIYLLPNQEITTPMSQRNVFTRPSCLLFPCREIQKGAKYVSLSFCLDVFY